MICPVCRAEPCYLSCEIPAYVEYKVKEAHEDLQSKYKAAMEKVAELTRNNQ